MRKTLRELLIAECLCKVPAMPTLRIKVHPSIHVEGTPSVIDGEFKEITILEAMNSLLDSYPDLMNLCLKDKKARPGILYIAEGAELASLGLLDNKLDEELEIRIVPILHGG